MEFHQIRYFLALAETLNFTKAAELCNVSQPSLTRAVQKLEEELGGALVFRERSNTHLTELGRVMVPQLRQIHDSAQNVKDVAGSFHSQSLASLRLVVSQSIESRLLAQPLLELSRAVPEIEIKLERLRAQDIVLYLKEGAADLAVAGRLETPWDRLDKWVLFSEGFSVLAPMGHDLAERRTIYAAELQHLGLLSRGFCEDTKPFLQGVTDPELDLKYSHSVSTENDLIAFVEAGFGCAVVPNSVNTPDTIVRVPISQDDISRRVNLFTVSGRQRSPACSTLVKLLRSIDWPVRIDARLAS